MCLAITMRKCVLRVCHFCVLCSVTCQVSPEQPSPCLCPGASRPSVWGSMQAVHHQGCPKIRLSSGGMSPQTHRSLPSGTQVTSRGLRVELAGRGDAT